MKNIVLILLVGLTLSSCFKTRRSDAVGEKMQEFIIGISAYARGYDADFIIIPQNGSELMYSYLTREDGFKPEMVTAIDGFGIEELFYDNTYQIDEERLGFLREIVLQKTVMVSEYVGSASDIPNALAVNEAEGFLCFPRSSDNYDYTKIPDTVYYENTNDIIKLSDAKNYLYLISNADYSTKQDFLDAIAATNFDVVLIDLFFEDTPFTAAEINSLKTKANGGQRLVISYISIGSAENYRYYWQEDWKLHNPNWLKKEYDGYEDEIWVKFWKQEWQDIIFGNDNSYIKKILNAGFDGAYLDNVEAYYFLYFD
ncbi:MAG: hypothetical protein C0592_02370 [Marinilabiliales bacterium]|nr:MAG: hypothetical protein C0592_02370 [Marinilabiliales bacterium]